MGGKPLLKKRLRHNTPLTRIPANVAYWRGIPQLTRPLCEVIADPQALPQELWRASRKSKAQVAAHPNCPVELWTSLLESHPVAALSNPSMGLFLLENLEIQQRINHRRECWTGLLVARLPHKLRQCFLNDILQDALVRCAAYFTSEETELVSSAISTRTRLPKSAKFSEWGEATYKELFYLNLGAASRRQLILALCTERVEAVIRLLLAGFAWDAKRHGQEEAEILDILRFLYFEKALYYNSHYRRGGIE